MLYNSRIIDTYIKLLKSKYVFVNVNELLNYAGMAHQEVADQGHWFSQEQVNRFHNKMTQLTGNKKIAREAGRYAASPDALGVMRQYTLGLVSPAYAFELINKVSTNFTRSSVYCSKKLASNKVEITVTPKPGVEEQAFQCENRMGFFEAIVLGFNYSIPKIEHQECMFKGDKICRYEITWEKVFSDVWRKVRLVFAVISIGTFAISMFISKEFAMSVILPFTLVAWILLTAVMENFGRKELRNNLQNFQNSTQSLVDQINTNYCNSILTNEIGQVISANNNVDDILDSVIGVLSKRLDFDRGLILLADEEKRKLFFKRAFGYSNDYLGLLKKITFHLDKPESKGPFVIAFRDRKPFLINNVNEIENTLSSHSAFFIKKLGIQSFICCPIVYDKGTIGILAVDNLKSKRPLLQSDVSLLMGIAPVLGVSIQNARLLEASQREMKSILQVLAASTDARDPLTAGHSEKVTEYSLGICKEMGMPPEYCEMIRVAALLHDYGKIGIPDSILKKEGKLSEEEYEIVKTHSEKTKRILEQINFEGIFRQVPEIAGAHHERVDGTGYPNGLTGKEIPLGAKIIAVADFFEAVTATRHYRGPMPLTVAIELLKQNIGLQFERKVVDAFIGFLNKACPEGFKNNNSHQKNPRIPFSASVFININNHQYITKSVDLSKGGMFIAADLKISEDAALDVSFSIPNSSFGKIETKGRVAWVNNENIWKKKNYPLGFGLEFDSGLKLSTDIISFVAASGSEGKIENFSIPREYILEKMGWKSL